MNNYYFTFGQNHVDNEDNLLRDYWVRVVSNSFWEARMLFVNRYAKDNLPHIDQWAFQYKEEEWLTAQVCFPGGELLLITEDEEEQKEDEK